jgi:hypothetical protein
MAATAISTEFTVMNIIRPVTAKTTTIDTLHFWQSTAVAVVASDARMSALENEIRLHIVIESPDIPCDRVVAAAAFSIEVITMRIVLLVTGNTIRVGIRKNLGSVAVIAFRFTMWAKAWEAGQIVVEEYRVLPINLGMAILALCAESAFVNLVIQVARLAAGLQFDFEYWFDMAINTNSRLVRAMQVVVRVTSMVK